MNFDWLIPLIGHTYSLEYQFDTQLYASTFIAGFRCGFFGQFIRKGDLINRFILKLRTVLFTIRALMYFTIRSMLFYRGYYHTVILFYLFPSFAMVWCICLGDGWLNRSVAINLTHPSGFSHCVISSR